MGTASASYREESLGLNTFSARSPHTLTSLAAVVWSEDGDTPDGRDRLIDHLHQCEACREEAVRAYAGLLLDQQRRAKNDGLYRRAEARAHVPTAVMRDEPTLRERISSLDTVMTGDDTGRGYTGTRPISAFREALDIMLPDGRSVRKATREQILNHVAMLKAQAAGAIAHAELLQALALSMRVGETALTAVRRLEQEANAQ